MFCAHCGTELDDGSAYCHSCGASIAPQDDRQRRFAVLAESPVFADAEQSRQVTSVRAGEELPIQEETPDCFGVHLPGGEVGYIRKSAGIPVRSRQASQPDADQSGWRPGGLEAILDRRSPKVASVSPSEFVEERAAEGATVQSASAIYLIINALLLISTFLPWERLGFINASGLELGRGWVVLVAALIAGVLAEESLRRGTAVTGLRVAQWGSGAAAMGMFAVELIVISSACSGDDNALFDLCVRPSLGIGAVLAGIGGLALALAATFRHPSQRGA